MNLDDVVLTMFRDEFPLLLGSIVAVQNPQERYETWSKNEVKI